MIHDLFTQHPVSSSIWTALAWCGGILIVAYVLAIATYRRKIAQGRVTSDQAEPNARPK
jgi:ABC-2 type transport system permease protein